MSGTLYLVATPIGNLEDMTFRAVRILKEADLIAAEDTRNSIKLLNHFEIRTPMTSYHEFNRFDKAAELVEQLLAGKTVACITDAGTPGISDPGEELVRQCYEAGIPVVPVPGACAAVNALVCSGLPTARFVFEGFLPTEKKKRTALLELLKQETRTVILYEAPHRLSKTLNELLEALGNRKINIAKELTKKHEAFFLTDLEQAVARYAAETPKGEYIILLEGVSPEQLKQADMAKWDSLSIEDQLLQYIEQGMDKKSAIRQVAQTRGLPKREVYQAALHVDSPRV